MTAEPSTDEHETVHACPPDDAATMPCCGRTPFEVSPHDRMTLDSEKVTCGVIPVPSSDAGGLPLDQIEARAEAATPGPWEAVRGFQGEEFVGIRVDDRPNIFTTIAEDTLTRADADFIAAARADVPVLVARVRALEAEVDRLRDERDLAVEGWEAEVQQLQEQNGRLEAWRATPRAFDWKGTF
jgi:hypothetical protein